MNGFQVAKFVGAWVCIVVACAFVVVGAPYSGLATTIAVISLAFSQAPLNYR